MHTIKSMTKDKQREAEITLGFLFLTLRDVYYHPRIKKEEKRKASYKMCTTYIDAKKEGEEEG